MNDPSPIHTGYLSRINKAFDYIEANLEKSMTLEELAAAANFSKYHFNRIFHAIIGETPFQFILRLRLEKAASLLISNKVESITEIAFKCGFSDISIFARNFKNYFKMSASQYRNEKLKNSNLSQQNSNKEQPDTKPLMYICPDTQTIKWRTNMKLNNSVEVKELPKMTFAYIRNIGPYNGDQEMFQRLRNKLFSWAGARGLIGGKDFSFMVLYHDNPNVAKGENLRMSLCIAVPPDTNVDGEIGKMEIDSNKYVIARFELTGPEFSEAWNWVYGKWFPESGYQPDDKPYFEMYVEAPNNGKYLVDFCVPVKPI